MRFITIIAPLLSGLAAVVAAGTSNPIQYPWSSATLHAGEQITIKWQPTTQGTITLQLRSGPFNDLDEGIGIASGLENTGSFTWTIPTSTKYSAYYTIEITSDEDESDINYSSQFAIQSSGMYHSLSQDSKSLGMTSTSSIATKPAKATVTSHPVKTAKPFISSAKDLRQPKQTHVHIPTDAGNVIEVRGGMVAAMAVAGVAFVL